MVRRFLCIVGGLMLCQGVAGADSVVVESYGGVRPAEAGELFGPVQEELASLGFISGTELAKRIEVRLSKPATVLSQAEIDTAVKFVKSGDSLYTQGNFRQAVKELTRALDALDSAPVTLAVHQPLREERFRALVRLAMAHSRLRNQTGTVAAMSELIRSFPTKEIPLGTFGPEARKLHRRVKRDLEKQGKGTLKVVVDDARTGVFVNERYAGGGTQTIANLAPGRYRVFVQQGKVPGRLHIVNVQPGTEASVNVTWKLDSALKSAGGVWLEHRDEGERAAGESAATLRLARTLGGRGAILLGLREVKGRRSVIGAYLTVDSTEPVRTAVLSADPVAPSESTLRDFAKFLAGDESFKGKFEALGAEDLVTAKPTNRKPLGGPVDVGGRPYRTWKWVSLASGLIALGGGGYLISIHEDEIVGGVRNPGARSTQPAGLAMVGVGGVLLLSSAYFWIKDAGDAKSSATAVLPTEGGAMVTFSGRF